jgi:hypothetical protein
VTRGVGEHRAGHRWWALAILVVSCLSLQLSPVPRTACCSNLSEQHELPDGKAGEEAKLYASRLRQRHIRRLPFDGGPPPLPKPERAPPVRIESLLHEDPRRAFLPRWTAPPEPSEHV